VNLDEQDTCISALLSSAWAWKFSRRLNIYRVQCQVVFKLGLAESAGYHGTMVPATSDSS